MIDGASGTMCSRLASRKIETSSRAASSAAYDTVPACSTRITWPTWNANDAAPRCFSTDSAPRDPSTRRRALELRQVRVAP